MKIMNLFPFNLFHISIWLMLFATFALGYFAGGVVKSIAYSKEKTKTEQYFKNYGKRNSSGSK